MEYIERFVTESGHQGLRLNDLKGHAMAGASYRFLSFLASNPRFKLSPELENLVDYYKDNDLVTQREHALALEVNERATE